MTGPVMMTAGKRGACGGLLVGGFARFFLMGRVVAGEVFFVPGAFLVRAPIGDVVAVPGEDVEVADFLAELRTGDPVPAITPPHIFQVLSIRLQYLVVLLSNQPDIVTFFDYFGVRLVLQHFQGIPTVVGMLQVFAPIFKPCRAGVNISAQGFVSFNEFLSCVVATPNLYGVIPVKKVAGCGINQKLWVSGGSRESKKKGNYYGSV